jgi:hypothetical protein
MKKGQQWFDIHCVLLPKFFADVMKVENLKNLHSIICALIRPSRQRTEIVDEDTTWFSQGAPKSSF